MKTVNVSELKAVNVSEIEGAALDWAVATAIWQFVGFYDGAVFRVNPDFDDGRWQEYSPSTDWSQCGPLIEENAVFLECTDEAQPKESRHWHAAVREKSYSLGSTPLIAACRAIVQSRLGDNISVPKELLK